VDHFLFGLRIDYLHISEDASRLSELDFIAQEGGILDLENEKAVVLCLPIENGRLLLTDSLEILRVLGSLAEIDNKSARIKDSVKVFYCKDFAKNLRILVNSFISLEETKVISLVFPGSDRIMFNSKHF
jgi:hypothetical protein